MTQSDNDIKKAVAALKKMNVPTANRVDLSQVATNEYGQPTDSKGNVKTQSQVIEAELEPILNKLAILHFGQYTNDQKADVYQDAKKELAALVLKHRHDVYFKAYKDGLAQGRQEANAIITSAKDVPPM